MHPQTSLTQNPGSAEWAAGAAFAGRVIGGLPGLVLAQATTEKEKIPVAAVAVRWIGQVAGAAGGAAVGAPEGLKGRAAVGAAIGGAVPLLGAPLAAVGAYLATRPKSRTNNPAANPGWVGEPPPRYGYLALSVLGVVFLGGATYYGVKAYKARTDKAETDKADEPTPQNVDEWGTDMDKNEHWGAGPVVGQDGRDYAYVIYHNLENDTYWIAYRGESGSGSKGPLATGEEAAWCVENQLPSPCFGYPGEG